MRFARLGQGLVHRRRLVVVVFAIGFVLAAATGSDVADKLSTGGFEDPSADSTAATDLLDEVFDAGEPNVVLLVTATDGTVDDPDVVAAATELTDELAAFEGVDEVVSYWSLGNAPPLRAGDSSSALVLARLGGTEDDLDDNSRLIMEQLTIDAADTNGPVTVGVSGRDAVFTEVGDSITSDLAKAELIAFPITLILLLFVFRSLVAATLPLAVGAIAIVGTFVVLELLAGITTVSIFALNLTTALGLGLAIDYSLFVVSRYREERAAGQPTDQAVIRTVATAGRAVFFSGLTVAVSLSALLVFPIAFLRSFAYAGIPVVALAVAGAVLFLPALMALLGDRIDKVSLPSRQRLAIEGSFWHRTATAVMRRPLPIATVTVLFLLFLGAPFLRIAFGLPDDRVLPESASTRQVSDQIRADYESNDTGAMSIVLPGTDPVDDAAALSAYAAQLSTLDGVARVDAATGIYLDGAQVPVDESLTERFVSESGGTWLSVVPSVEPVSAAGEELVETVRAAPTPGDDVALVGGVSAQLVDIKDGIFSRLGWAVAIVVLATFVLLFLMFGSVLVPIKALVLNTLSLTATFGAMVWIFQDGHFDGLLGFTATGQLDTTTPVLMFCVAFGLSMDYEVFLLSRIKEEYDRTGDNTRSVALGLARTGRIITAAAVLISVVFLSFATSSISFIKLFGVGLTLAVLMDATVVRAVLVPAFMKLAGHANWWAPAPMRRLYERAGLSESHAERGLIDLREPAIDAKPGGDSAAPEPELTGTRNDP